MKVLFLTLLGFESLNDSNIYTDLLREFVKNGHDVYAISPVEKRYNISTHLVTENKATILRLKIGNIQKTNVFEKGLSTVLIEPIFKHAIKHYFPDVKFDLILYSTPPITLVSVIEFVKKRDNAKTYLLLKDIFPQNALDIGILTKHGLKGVIYKHFRKTEQKLYSISDRIGCMSQANVNYVLNHNSELNPDIVEVCPNCIDVLDKSVDSDKRIHIRNKYGIPVDKKVFIYGGNLGKPQGIAHLIDCMKKCCDISNAFFLIVGDGTEYDLIKNFIDSEKPNNVCLMKRLPKDDYDTMVGACDVGMIFLDHRFTIPNFPSRLLSYMQAKIPVLACTDPNTDIGRTIVEGGFGWWCESDNAMRFYSTIIELLKSDFPIKEKEFDYLLKNYHSSVSYNIIIKGFYE